MNHILSSNLWIYLTDYPSLDSTSPRGRNDRIKLLLDLMSVPQVAERMTALSRIYGFWKYVTNLEWAETSRYLVMFCRNTEPIGAVYLTRLRRAKVNY
jgi:hypothetical protein